MQQQVFKCSNCGGDKVRFIANNVCECLYCGQIINVGPQPQQRPPVPPQQQQMPPQQMPPQRPPQQPPFQQPYQQQPRNPRPQPMYADRKSKVTAIILALLLGGLGVHKFYLRQSGLGVLYLLFCWTYIPGIVSFIEVIVLAVMSDAEFDRKYNPVIMV